MLILKQMADGGDLHEAMENYEKYLELVTRVGSVRGVGDLRKYSIRKARRIIVMDQGVPYNVLPTLMSLQQAFFKEEVLFIELSFYV